MIRIDYIKIDILIIKRKKNYRKKICSQQKVKVNDVNIDWMPWKIYRLKNERERKMLLLSFIWIVKEYFAKCLSRNIVLNDFICLVHASRVQLPLNVHLVSMKMSSFPLHSMYKYLNYDTKYYLWGGYEFFLHSLSIHLTLYQSVPTQRRKRLYFYASN